MKTADHGESPPSPPPHPPSTATLEIESPLGAAPLPPPPPPPPSHQTYWKPAACAAIYVILVGIVALAFGVSFTRTRTADGSTPPPPDYTLDSSWAALPERSDGADVVPAECGLDQQGQSPPADTFYIHPTSFMASPDSLMWNAPVDDLMTNLLTDNGQLTQQASAFNGVSRVFAPRYRQVSQFGQDEAKTFNPSRPPSPPPANSSSSIGETTQGDPARRLRQAMDLAFGDVVRAFDHFLATWNDGRPIIVASHSQGTFHAKKLLAHLHANRPPAVLDRVVVAYIIGNTVQPEDVPLPPCATPDATRCFVTWNTLSRGAANTSHWTAKLIAYPGRGPGPLRAACVNPLTWRNDSAVGNRSLHLGAMPVTAPLFVGGFDRNMISAYCDASTGMLVVDPDPAGTGAFGYFSDMTFKTAGTTTGGEYHAFDINLFYRNIRVNAMERVVAFTTTDAGRDAAAGGAGAAGAGPDWSSAEVDLKVCPECGANPSCAGTMMLQGLVALITLYALFAVLAAPVYLPIFCLVYSRTTRGRGKRRCPDFRRMFWCFGWCCCCACSRGGAMAAAAGAAVVTTTIPHVDAVATNSTIPGRGAEHDSSYPAASCYFHLLERQNTCAAIPDDDMLAYQSCIFPGWQRSWRGMDDGLPLYSGGPTLRGLEIGQLLAAAGRSTGDGAGRVPELPAAAAGPHVRRLQAMAVPFVIRQGAKSVLPYWRTNLILSEETGWGSLVGSLKRFQADPGSGGAKTAGGVGYSLEANVTIAEVVRRRAKERSPSGGGGESSTSSSRKGNNNIGRAADTGMKAYHAVGLTELCEQVMHDEDHHASTTKITIEQEITAMRPFSEDQRLLLKGTCDFFWAQAKALHDADANNGSTDEGCDLQHAAASIFSGGRVTNHKLTLFRHGFEDMDVPMHWDPYNNFFVQLYGRKTVYLAHPFEGGLHVDMDEASPTFRHSTVDPRHPDLPRHADFPEALALATRLEAGDLLYIPTNWHHFIHAEALPLAQDATQASINENGFPASFPSHYHASVNHAVRHRIASGVDGGGGEEEEEAEEEEEESFDWLVWHACNGEHKAGAAVKEEL